MISLLLIAQLLSSLPGHNSIFRPDSVVGWRMKSNVEASYQQKSYIKTNSYGYRDSEWDQGGRNIAVVGDSFTSGFGVDKPFSECLQDSLGIEVMNFGVNGYSPLQELMILKSDVLQWHPEIVILCIYIRNDFDDLAGRNWIGNYKRPYVLEKDSVDYKRYNWFQRAAGMARIYFGEEPEIRLDQGYYFPEMRAVINRFAAMVQQSGAKFILLIAQSMISVSASYKMKFEKKYNRQLDFERPIRFLRSLGYETVCPRLPEEDYKGAAPLHWNFEGHRKVANALYRRISHE